MSEGESWGMESKMNLDDEGEGESIHGEGGLWDREPAVLGKTGKHLWRAASKLDRTAHYAPYAAMPGHPSGIAAEACRIHDLFKRASIGKVRYVQEVGAITDQTASLECWEERGDRFGAWNGSSLAADRRQRGLGSGWTESRGDWSHCAKEGRLIYGWGTQCHHFR